MQDWHEKKKDYDQAESNWDKVMSIIITDEQWLDAFLKFTHLIYKNSREERLESQFRFSETSFKKDNYYYL